MKYCLNFNRDSKYMNDVDELIIQYKPEYKEYESFIEKHKHQRIILNIEDAELFLSENSMDTVAKTGIVLKLNYYYDDYVKLLCKILNESNYPFFISDYASTWDELKGIIKLGVSDVYVAEELGFDIIAVSAYCKEHNVRVRVYPNVSQSSWLDPNNSNTDFFIRPEDTVIYEPYIDVFEFFEKENNTQDTFYKIYAKKGAFYGPVNTLIIGNYITVQNNFIAPDYAKHRLDCQKKCARGQKCNLCQTTLDFAETTSRIPFEHKAFLNDKE